MNKARVGLVGASGYTGAVAARMLATHPGIELVFATSDKWAGDELADRLGSPVRSRARFVKNADGAARFAEVDAVLLATSAEVSIDLAPKARALGKAVIDFSGAFRLASAADFQRWYKLEHAAPGLLAQAFYGLPELFGAPPARAADGLPALIANPGCYATASIVGLAPLAKAGLIERDGVFLDGKSGVSGAGRQAKEEYSFVEVENDLRAYRLLNHQHTPEIARFASAHAGEPVKLTFTPHLIPVSRGLIVSGYARPRGQVTARDVDECLREAYRDAPFVRVRACDRVGLAGVVGTNECHVGATANEDAVVFVSALDNLVKGAGGQAIQNLNLLLGLDEATGLDGLARVAP
jgi:N-acetyl-gamma-glutamyl-phosphate reductase